MAKTSAAAPEGDDPNKKRKEPLTPAQRRQLQQLFEFGNKAAANGQYDYATDMYTKCVVVDPGNPIYVRNFLGNLQKKYNNNKKGSKLAMIKGAGSKGLVKKCAMQKDWSGVIANGLEVLKHNPWDSATLADIGRACQELEHDECQLEYLKMAFDAYPDDLEVNRVYGRALGRQGHFDEAIACFDRVRKVKPQDEEAGRAIADLTVERTIHKGGYEEAESANDVRARKMSMDRSELDEAQKLSPEQQLEWAIEKDPTDIEKYVELADLHARNERYQQGEEALTRAMAASGGDLKIRERHEDMQLRRARQQVAIAEQKAVKEKTDEATKLHNRLKAELNRKEIEVYASRCERYPTNIGLKYELAVRLQREKKYVEAVKLFQEARSDQKRRGHVYMALGHCFTALKQYSLSMQNFEQAAQELGDRDIELKKECIYNAARVAVHLKDYEKAQSLFSQLASIDFGYKDVAEWLDKLVRLREDGEDISDDDE